jgi:cytochrome b subunit of formate dehydrogenase
MDYRKFFIYVALLVLLTCGIVVFITYTYTSDTPDILSGSVVIMALKLLIFGGLVIAHLYLNYIVLLFLFRLLQKLLQFISYLMRRISR